MKILNAVLTVEELTGRRWQRMSFCEQMANIGSEVT